MNSRKQETLTYEIADVIDGCDVIAKSDKGYSVSRGGLPDTAAIEDSVKFGPFYGTFNDAYDSLFDAARDR